MRELVFESSRSIEDIEKDFEGMDFDGELLKSLGQALAYAKGEEDAGVIVHKRSIPDESSILRE